MKNFMASTLLFLLTANSTFAQKSILKNNEASEPNKIIATPQKLVERIEIVSGSNRLNFYRGQAFAHLNWSANAIANYGLKDEKLRNNIVVNSKILIMYLREQKARDEVAAEVKKLETMGDFGTFVKNMNEINEGYQATLSKIQLWYYKAGSVCGEIGYALAKEDAGMFSITNEGFENALKKIPAEIPPSLISALRKTAQVANSSNFKDYHPEAIKFQNVRTELDGINEIIGKIANSDFKN